MPPFEPIEVLNPLTMSGRLKKGEELKVLDSIKLSEYILAKLGSMNQLKMQKLLYYVEAFHQAYFECPVIEDEFEAWVHGPVSRKVWNDLKDVSLLYDDISFVDESDSHRVIQAIEGQLSLDQVDLIEDVLGEYGVLSAYKLECLTHEEAPWIEARRGVPPGDPSTNLISKDLMRTFYRKMLYSN